MPNPASSGDPLVSETTHDCYKVHPGQTHEEYVDAKNQSAPVVVNVNVNTEGDPTVDTPDLEKKSYSYRSYKLTRLAGLEKGAMAGRVGGSMGYREEDFPTQSGAYSAPQIPMAEEDQSQLHIAGGQTFSEEPGRWPGLHEERQAESGNPAVRTEAMPGYSGGPAGIFGQGKAEATATVTTPPSVPQFREEETHELTEAGEHNPAVCRACIREAYGRRWQPSAKARENHERLMTKLASGARINIQKAYNPNSPLDNELLHTLKVDHNPLRCPRCQRGEKMRRDFLSLVRM